MKLLLLTVLLLPGDFHDEYARRMDTRHFTIIYPEGMERPAMEVAGHLEARYPLLSFRSGGRLKETMVIYLVREESAHYDVPVLHYSPDYNAMRRNAERLLAERLLSHSYASRYGAGYWEGTGEEEKDALVTDIAGTAPARRCVESKETPAFIPAWAHLLEYVSWQGNLVAVLDTGDAADLFLCSGAGCRRLTADIACEKNLAVEGANLSYDALLPDGVVERRNLSLDEVPPLQSRLQTNESAPWVRTMALSQIPRMHEYYTIVEYEPLAVVGSAAGIRWITPDFRHHYDLHGALEYEERSVTGDLYAGYGYSFLNQGFAVEAMRIRFHATLDVASPHYRRIRYGDFISASYWIEHGGSRMAFYTGTGENDIDGAFLSGALFYQYSCQYTSAFSWRTEAFYEAVRPQGGGYSYMGDLGLRGLYEGSLLDLGIGTAVGTAQNRGFDATYFDCQGLSGFDCVALSRFTRVYLTQEKGVTVWKSSFRISFQQGITAGEYADSGERAMMYNLRSGFSWLPDDSISLSLDGGYLADTRNTTSEGKVSLFFGYRVRGN